MARADWAIMSGSADGTGWGGTTILRDATFGIVPPNGGGAAVFGINSIRLLVMEWTVNGSFQTSILINIPVILSIR